MKNKFLILLEKYLGALLIRLLHSTCRITQENLPKDEEQKIFTSWHCNLLALSYAHRHDGSVALVSASKDGQLIAGPLEALGFETVRGSSGRNSIASLLKMLKIKKSMAIAVDGPKGPAGKCKLGILYIAQKKSLPIVCASVQFSSAWQIPSWDRLKIAKPFSKISIKYQTVYIGKNENIEEKAKIIEKKINGN